MNNSCASLDLVVITAENVVEEETDPGLEDHPLTPDPGAETSVHHPVEPVVVCPMVMSMCVTVMLDQLLIRTMPQPPKSHK